jgi:threonine dehydrogenase-like Zn-dependent dehydrogenase
MSAITPERIRAARMRHGFVGVGRSQDVTGFSDEEALFLTDILPTGYSGIEWAGVKGRESVAVLGCGPVVLMAQKCARLRGAKRVIGLNIPALTASHFLTLMTSEFAIRRAISRRLSGSTI